MLRPASRDSQHRGPCQVSANCLQQKLARLRFMIYALCSISTSYHIERIYVLKIQTVVARDGLKLFVIVCQEFVGVVTYSEESVRHQVNEGC